MPPILISDCRKSLRIPHYDYSQDGYYFVTINTDKGKYLFGSVVNKQIELSNLGKIINENWKKIPNYYPNIKLDIFQVMPNHIHGIIIINSVGAGLAPAPSADKLSAVGATARVAPTNRTFCEMIGSFKSRCVVEWLNYIKNNRLNLVGKFWQRNYWEHVIRNERELSGIQNYIVNNPPRWEFDKNNFESKIPLKKRGQW